MKFIQGTTTVKIPVKMVNVRVVPERKAEKAENISVRNIVNCTVSLKYSFFSSIIFRSFSLFCFSEKPILVEIFSMFTINTIMGVNWYMNRIVLPMAMFNIMNEIKVATADESRDMIAKSVNCLLFVIKFIIKGITIRSELYSIAVVIF